MEFPILPTSIFTTCGSQALYGVGGGGGGSIIQSIQAGTILMAGGVGSNTYTLPTAVVMANAAIIWNGVQTSGASSSTWGRNMCRLSLTGTTTVTANRDQSASDSLTVAFTVVEFVSGVVNSIQPGTIPITAGNTSNTGSLSPSVGANAFVLYVGASTANGGLSYGGSQVGVQLTSSSLVTATLSGTYTSTVTVGYIVVDLTSSAVQSVQQRAAPNSSAATNFTDTISAVTMGQTLLFPAGDDTTTVISNNTGFCGWTMQLTGTSTVTFNRTGSGATAQTIYYTAVQFAAAAVASVQRGTIALVSAASNTAPISSVVQAKSFVNNCCFLANNAAANVCLGTLTLTNATTVTCAVNAAGTVTYSYEVISFN